MTEFLAQWGAPIMAFAFGVAGYVYGLLEGRAEGWIAAARHVDAVKYARVDWNLGPHEAPYGKPIKLV
jgi:hypothetical protein